MRYDVAVIGLGGMGSAIAAHCATRGASVVGLEQFGRAHEWGSSTGRSRLIRKAYFEDPAYVPLLQRAYELWRELEHASGEELLKITGLLLVGQGDAAILRGAQAAAHEHGLDLERLNAREIAARYPTVQLLPNEIGLFEAEGGVLAPERASEAHLGVAARAGAHLRFGAAVSRWAAGRDQFQIELADESRVSARRLVFATGPWFKELLGELGIRLNVQRNVQAWFRPATDVYGARRFPPFLVDRENLPAPLYGFPDFGEGVKAAFHAHGASTDARSLDREIDLARDIAPLAAALEAWLPGAARHFRAAKVCPYSLTPDGHFIIDRHPTQDGLVLCGGFSGHGFKFAPLVGEVVADLALEGGSRHEIGFLSLGRFADAERSP